MDSSSAQPNTTTYRVPLVIQSEANATEGKEEDVLHVEQMIRNHRNIRGKERKPHRRTVMFDESSTPRYTPQHSISKDRRSEALANTAPTTIIVEDPNEKALMFPYDLCHTWKVSYSNVCIWRGLLSLTYVSGNGRSDQTGVLRR